jgi:dihydrofolate reductase
MRKLRIFEHVSLDGVIQNGRDEDGDFPYGDWKAPYRSPAGAQALVEAQGERFDFVLGRRTYELWSGYWPTVKSGPFAAAMNAATKYVATHRPDSLAWGPVETLGGDVVEGVRRLRSTEGPDLIVFGSSTLTSLLLDDGMVDEVVLLVYPVLLGRGKRILSDRVGARELALVSTKATPTGVLINRYRHVGSLRAGH